LDFERCCGLWSNFTIDNQTPETLKRGDCGCCFRTVLSVDATRVNSLSLECGLDLSYNCRIVVSAHANDFDLVERDWLPIAIVFNAGNENSSVPTSSVSCIGHNSFSTALSFYGSTFSITDRDVSHPSGRWRKT